MTTAQFFQFALPGLIAIAGNFLFYLFIKNRVDKSLEIHKISFSGIFKEKIDIYKEVLKKTYDLKQSVHHYNYQDGSDGAEIRLEFNEYIRFYSINKPFLSETIIQNIKQLVSELQTCYEDFYWQNTIGSKTNISHERRTEILNKYFESGNKFKKNNPFETLENNIINEIKTELQIIKK